MAWTQPDALLNLTYLEKRLISVMRVTEFLIELPTSKAPGRFGRVYVCPVDEPYAVSVLKELNAASTRDGLIYVIPPSRCNSIARETSEVSRCSGVPFYPQRALHPRNQSPSGNNQ
eukprot:5979112-Amphidinium_carterae.1